MNDISPYNAYAEKKCNIAYKLIKLRRICLIKLRKRLFNVGR